MSVHAWNHGICLVLYSWVVPPESCLPRVTSEGWGGLAMCHWPFAPCCRKTSANEQEPYYSCWQPCGPLPLCLIWRTNLAVGNTLTSDNVHRRSNISISACRHSSLAVEVSLQLYMIPMVDMSLAVLGLSSDVSCSVEHTENVHLWLLHWQAPRCCCPFKPSKSF